MAGPPPLPWQASLVAAAQGCTCQADRQSDGTGAQAANAGALPPPWIRWGFSTGGCGRGTRGFPAGIGRVGGDGSWGSRGRLGSWDKQWSASPELLSPPPFESLLFIHERLSYLRSFILRGFFHPKRFQVSSNQPPPSCQAAGHLVTQGFLFWQPCHPRLPGEFSLGFNEMFVLHQEEEVAFSWAALLLLPSFAGPRHRYTPQARSLHLLQQHGLANHRPAFPS